MDNENSEHETLQGDEFVDETWYENYERNIRGEYEDKDIDDQIYEDEDREEDRNEDGNEVENENETEPTIQHRRKSTRSQNKRSSTQSTVWGHFDTKTNKHPGFPVCKNVIQYLQL